MSYSTTLLIKKRPSQKKPKAVKDRGGGSRVGLIAVKDSIVLFKASLTKVEQPGYTGSVNYPKLDTRISVRT